jgi:hypothetical protein
MKRNEGEVRGLKAGIKRAFDGARRKSEDEEEEVKNAELARI